METFITFIHVVVALFMILVVLVQGGNQGGVGAAFGSGGSGSVMGATGGQSFLGKLTYGAAAIFMITSVILTKVQSETSSDLKERLKQRSEESATATGAAASETGTAAEAGSATGDEGNTAADQ